MLNHIRLLKITDFYNIILNKNGEIVSNLVNILKSFLLKCKEHKIWYSVGGESLLNLKNNELKTDQKYIEIFMLNDDFDRFQNLFPNNILSSHISSDYLFTSPIYFENKEESFIKISLLVRASIKKTEKFYTLKNITRQKISFYESFQNASSFLDKTKKKYYKFLTLFYSPLSYEEIISNVYDKENYQGFFIIDSLKPNINKNWIPALSFKLTKENWNNLELNIMNEWEVFLIKRYGNDWNKNPVEYKKLDITQLNN